MLISAILCFGCNNTPSDSNTDPADSSLKASKEVSKEDGELKEIVEGYVRLYQSPFIIDSSYILGKDTIRISLKHQCLMDSAVIIPTKYVGIYKLDSFVTHNFATSIKVEKNKNVVAERNISKNDFNRFLDSNLRDYGVLIYPSIKSLNDSVEVSYSISIPLTDIGIGVGAIIKNDGSLSFIQR